MDQCIARYPLGTTRSNIDVRYLFSRTVMFYDDTRTAMVEHKICSLTSALGQISHVDNIAEEQSGSQSGLRSSQ